MRRPRPYRRWFTYKCRWALLVGAILIACGSPPPQPSLEALLVSEEALPAGWQLEEVIEIERGNELENRAATFAYRQRDTMPINQIVYRYRSEWKAHSGFNTFVQDDVRTYGDVTRSTTLAYPSSYAKRSIVHCATHLRRDPGRKFPLLCLAYAQYGAYVTAVSGFINNNSLDADAFQRLLEVVDARMRQVIEP